MTLSAVNTNFKVKIIIKLREHFPCVEPLYLNSFISQVFVFYTITHNHCVKNKIKNHPQMVQQEYVKKNSRTAYNVIPSTLFSSIYWKLLEKLKKENNGIIINGNIYSSCSYLDNNINHLRKRLIDTIHLNAERSQLSYHIETIWYIWGRGGVLSVLKLVIGLTHAKVK